jgi:hypothetical protein
MPSGKVCVTLLKSKNLVEDFQKKNGHANFSEALRYIIEDYFKLREKLDQARTADFEKLFDLLSGKACNDFNGAVIEDLNEIKGTMEELRNMFLVVGNCDERFREGFIKYFPKYFKAASNE